MHSVLELQSTDAAFRDPKSNFVAVVPTANPVPVIATIMPPAVGPLFGLTPVTVGRNLKRSADEIALVPPGVVTVTSTAPAGSVGETALSEVALVTVNVLAVVAPNVTAVARARFAPLMLMVVPPPTGPLPGKTFVTLGGLGSVVKP
jgi:hypothetical protein